MTNTRTAQHVSNVHATTLKSKICTNPNCKTRSEPTQHVTSLPGETLQCARSDEDITMVFVEHLICTN